MCHDYEKLYRSEGWVHPQINYKEKKRMDQESIDKKNGVAVFF